jgi:hypothetical protein
MHLHGGAVEDLETFRLVDHEWYLDYSTEDEANNQCFGGTMVPINSVDDTLEAVKATVDARAIQKN